MKRKISALLTAFSVIISISACGQADMPAATTTTSALTSSTTIAEQTTTTAAAHTSAEITSEITTEITTITEEETKSEVISTETTTETITTIATTAETTEETTTTSSTDEITTTKATTTEATTTEATTAKTTTAETTTAETTATESTSEVKSENNPVAELVYEAENVKLNGGLTVITKSSFSGGKGVENFAEESDYIVFSVKIPDSGMYDITFVSSGIGSYKENNVIIDGVPVGVFTSENEKLTESVIPSVNLSKGSHEIKITKSWGWIRLDCIRINKAEGISNEIYEVGNTLINKNANENTKALFRYLSECYGKYVISGQVCDDGYYGKEFSAIFNETGKRPAILGLDMMDYTPSRTALGAKSHAVDTAVEFSDMGGIVTFCWHWNAPTEYLKDGRDSDNGNPRWWGGFYSRNSTFDIEKVMNGQDPDGKAAIDRDIEEIALQLKRLDNAGVPVLWRPLHEASGGWFWWGAKGPDAYKKLWIYLYEELTYKYECNNLIWVFNAQSSDWYPGDEYVDIIGEDIYPGEHVYAPQTAKFKDATAYSGNNKIVALTENGCIFDIDQAVETNTMWAWFCTWCGEFVANGSVYSEKFTEKKILKKVYNSDYVITFDELPDIY